MGRVKAWMMDREDRAADRGAADRYYGRQPEPHIWLDNIGKNVVSEVDRGSFEGSTEDLRIDRILFLPQHKH